MWKTKEAKYNRNETVPGWEGRVEGRAPAILLWASREGNYPGALENIGSQSVKWMPQRSLPAMKEFYATSLLDWIRKILSVCTLGKSSAELFNFLARASDQKLLIKNEFPQNVITFLHQWANKAHLLLNLAFLSSEDIIQNVTCRK